ncbi:MAG TPA: UDP-2,3-diacylglucosamine diphosphatase, partial [Bacteroidales bacterium]|nr:UDP-2,3-diacylglucosamine diphosphatase [Bacteroidales bacterium]
MGEKDKIYFISDVHLGLYPPANSARRELLLVSWLDSIKNDASELYLMGDIFDFWHEYKHVVPRGFVRTLGKLAELGDNGTKLHFFTGNHDIWAYDYLESEIGIKVYRENITRTINGKKFFLGHGDGVGPGDHGYKLMKWSFTNKVLQWIFARIHPNASIAFGKRWSKSSRYAKGLVAEPYKGDDNELQVVFARSVLEKEYFDYFILGHRHIPFDVQIAPSTRIINLGDWITHFT